MAASTLGKIAKQGGGRLFERAVDKVVVNGAPKDGHFHFTFPRKLAGMALLRVATGSVPGAIVVGGGLLAKYLYDKKKAHEAEAKAVQQPATPAKQRT
ncbi:MAG TPA: hypothetical protein VN222_17320 [Novosphingobium sp.]|nr:hypothetical protein [Novosphingobium sp.]